MTAHDDLGDFIKEHYDFLCERIKRGQMKAGQVRIVVGILKKRFPNLTTEETVDIAMNILEAIDEEREKQ